MDDATVAAWVLLAMSATARSGDAPLDRVLAAADMINHAVLTRSELDLAVQILEGSGLVTAQGTTLRLTDAGRSELKISDSTSWHEALTKLRNRLEMLGITERSDWRIRTAEFNAAVESYLAGMVPKRKR
jgi:hypothetical protein